MKKAVSIITVVLMIVGWLLVAKDISSQFIDYGKSIALAKESVEAGLYEQGVEYYNAALLKDDSDVEIYKAIKEAYFAFYEEQQNSYSYNLYKKALEKCCEVYENNLPLWEELIGVYYDEQDYKDVVTAIRKASQKKVTSEWIEEILFEVNHLYDVSFQSISSYRIGKNNRYTVANGTVYWMADQDGERYGQDYIFAGPMNEDGKCVVIDNGGCTIRDVNQITRVKLDEEITDSGYFNSGFVPVKVSDKWVFLKEDGTQSELGSFTMAGSMYEGKAAVQQEEKWTILSADTSIVNSENVDGMDEFAAFSDPPYYDEIALDKYGCHTQGKFYLAKEDGKYGIYNLNDVLIAGLDAEAVDLGESNEYFAFKSIEKGLWGFADAEGNVVIEPQYHNAKGFSNGYAAVADENGLWGFINADGVTVIEPSFYSAGYFGQNKMCFVSRTEGAMGLLSFTYQK